MAEVLDPNAKIEVGEKLTDNQAGELLKKRAERKAKPIEQATPVQTPIEGEKRPEQPVITEDKKPTGENDKTPSAEQPKATEPAEQPKKKKSAKETKDDFFKVPVKEEKSPDVNELKSLLEAERKARLELENELKDPIYQVSKAIKEKGRKALDVFKEIKVVDHSKMSDEELIKHELTKIGVTDTEEIENELAKFSEQSAISKKKELDLIRKGIDADNENVEKQFLSKINAQDPDDEKLRAQALKEGEEIYNAITGLIDRPVVDGVMFTKDIAAKILDNIANSRVLIPKKEDGTTDINALVQREIKAEMFDICIDVLTANTEAETIHKVYDEIEATPDSHTQTQRMPQPIHKVEKGTEEYGKLLSETLTPRRQ